MKKRLRSFTAILLAVVMMLCLIVISPITVNALSKSADDAINWCASKIGQALDYDGAYGAQCVDFIMYYYQFLGVSGGGGNACDYVSNTLPSGFTRTKGGQPQKGDILIYTGGYGHVAIYESDNVSYHQNWGGQYVQKVERYYGNSVWVQSEGVTKTYWGCIHPNFASGHNPEGVVDVIEGGSGKIHVRGWAFDRDDFGNQIPIHVYIGGRSGDPNAEGHAITANTQRTDVNAVYGCGDWHGFDAEISTSKRGNQPVYIYALNIGAGNDNPQIGEGTANISEDTNVKNVWINQAKEVLKIGETNTFTFGADNATRIDFRIDRRLGTNSSTWKYEDNVTSPKTFTFNEPGFYCVWICGHNANNTSNVDSTKLYFDVVESDNDVISLEDSTPLIEQPKLDLGTDFYATIKHTYSGKLVTDNGVFDSNGVYSNAVIYTDNGFYDRQVWKFIKNDDGSYEITSLYSDKCLDNYLGSGKSGSNVVVHTRNNTDPQKWFIVKGKAGATYLIPKTSNNNALDLYGNDSSDNQNIQLWENNGLPAQRFSIDKLDWNFDSIHCIDEIQYNGHVYRLYQSRTLWNFAKDWCEKQGGYLATFTSADEFNEVKQMLSKHNYPLTWIGATRTSGTWKWITGEPFSYNNWDTGSGQPDNYNGVEWYAGTWSEAKWNDFSIGSSSSNRVTCFICEFENTDFSLTATVDNNESEVTIFHNSVFGAQQYMINIYDSKTNELVFSNDGLPDREIYIKLGNGDYYANITTDNNLISDDVYFSIKKPLIGDTNLDGSININDVTAIQRHLVELETFDDEQLALADTNGDGEISISDATHLQMYLAEYGVVLGKQS